jgi:hypothetical protein
VSEEPALGRGPVCGTYAGYQRHRRVGEEACAACRAASAAYMRDIRNRKPEMRSAAYRQYQHRERALAELRRRHEDEYQEIITALYVSGES